MSLSNKEISSIIYNPTTFYLYKDKATSKDLIKIVDEVFDRSPKFIVACILLFIQNVHKTKPELLTDDVKYKILFNTIKLNREDFDEILNAFHKHHISMSDVAVNDLINSICVSENVIPIHQAYYICDIVHDFQPKLTSQTIANILKNAYVEGNNELFCHITDQLIADHDFLAVLADRRLFSYMKRAKSPVAKEMVKKAIDTQEIKFVMKHTQYERDSLLDSLLFSDDLVEQMVDFCIKEHKPELIFNNPQLLNYATKNKPEIAQQAINQLFQDKKERIIATDKDILDYIIKNRPELVKKIPYTKLAMETVKQEKALDLLNLMNLPDADLEFAYISRNHTSDAKFPPKEKLSNQTRTYIDIISGKETSEKVFASLDSRTIDALVWCRFVDQSDWYKTMEKILIANPFLDKRFIQHMLNQDKNAEVLIKRYWKQSLRKMRFDNFLERQKQKLTNAFGTNQKSR